MNSALAGLGLAGEKLAAVPAASSLAAASTRQTGEGEDYYQRLGVTKIINAAGNDTALTASIMPESVQAAVARAAKNPVRLQELQKAASVNSSVW